MSQIGAVIVTVAVEGILTFLLKVKESVPPPVTGGNPSVANSALNAGSPTKPVVNV